MSGLDRVEILRRDCATCRGNGYVTKAAVEEMCSACSGSGTEEKEVPFKFDGVRTQDEINEIWNQ